MRNKFFYLQTLHFLNDGFSATLLLFLPFIAKDLGLNLTQVGILGTGLSLVPIVLALPSAFLANKFGSFKILLWAALVYSFGYLAVAGARGYLSLLIIFIAIGSGFGLFHPIAFSLVARWSEPGKQGRRLGNFTGWGVAGRIVLTGGVTFLIVAWGWRFTSLVYSVLGLIVVAYIYFFHFRKNLLPQNGKLIVAHKFRHLFSNKKFIFAVLAGGLDDLSSSPLFLFLPFLLLSKNIQPTFLSAFAVAFLAGNMLGKIIFGRWADKLGNVTVFVAAQVVMAAVVVLLSLVNSMLAVVTLSVALGITTRGTVAPSRAMLNEAVAHTDNYEHANSLAEMMYVIMYAATPFLLGMLSDTLGIAGAFRAWSGLALLAVIPAVAFAWIKKTEGMGKPVM